MDSKIPEILTGNISCDDRGYVRFVNDFDPSTYNVRRFYQVSNHAQNYIRAWHGHMHEAKFVYVVAGSAKIATVPIKGKDTDGSENRPKVHYLTSAKPQVLYIPPSHANGFQTLEPNTSLLFFSTSTLEQSLQDDIRFPWDHWDPYFAVWTNTFR